LNVRVFSAPFGLGHTLPSLIFEFLGSEKSAICFKSSVKQY